MILKITSALILTASTFMTDFGILQPLTLLISAGLLAWGCHDWEKKIRQKQTNKINHR